MSIVRARLVANSGVTDLVSTRVYQYQLKQDCTLPAVAFSFTGDEPQNSIGGETALKNETYEIECVGKLYSDAESVADAVDAAMTASGSDFEAIRINKDYVFEEPTGLYIVSLEYSIWY